MPRATSDAQENLVPPHDLDGPPQVQCLLTHLASAWDFRILIRAGCRTCAP